MQRPDDKIEMITDTKVFQQALDAAVANFTEAGEHEIERKRWNEELEACIAEIEGRPRGQAKAA